MTPDPLIRPAGPDDIDLVCDLLYTRMNRKISPDRWRRLMTYGWLEEKPDLGRVVEHNGEILGYLGMVYSSREVDGKSESIVNICAWYLDKSLRRLGLGKAVMAQATSDPSKSYTIMTSSKNTTGILFEVGYEVLDKARFVWTRQSGTGPALTVIDSPDRIYPDVTPAQIRLLEDHAGLPVKPVLATHGKRQCLLFLSIKRKARDILYCDVLYTSNRDFLGEYGQYLANSLLPEPDAVFTADCRFIQGAAAGAEREVLPVPRFFKTSRLQPRDLDHMYTELQLLDLKLD